MRKILLTSALIIFVPAALQAQDPPRSLNAYLNQRIETVISARVDLREKTRQTETPASSANSTSLVDRSSASSLIGVGLNLAGLSAISPDTDEADSLSVTATAYSLLAAAKGVDPLNPGFYDRHRAWRSLSVTLGFDDPSSESDVDPKSRTKLFGFKYMFVNGREPGKHPQQLQIIRESLERAAGGFGRLSDRVIAHIFRLAAVRDNLIRPGFKAHLEVKKARERDTAVVSRIDALLARDVAELFVFGSDNLPSAAWTLEEREYFVAFQNQFLVGPGFQQLLNVMGQDELDRIDRIIEQEIDPFLTLHKVSNTAIEKIRKAPQFSLAFLSKQRASSPDDYLVEAILDYGIQDRLDLTINGAFQYRDSKIIGGDTRGARFAAQLEFQITPETRLAGRSPFKFYLSTEGNWMSGADWIYKGQAKINLPIADGIDFPISLTVANKTELIDEREVRGQFGFTFDLARLIKALAVR